MPSFIKAGPLNENRDDLGDPFAPARLKTFSIPELIPKKLARSNPKISAPSNPDFQDLNLSHLTSEEREKIMAVMQRASGNQDQQAPIGEVRIADKKVKKKITQRPLEFKDDLAMTPFVVPSLELPKKNKFVSGNIPHSSTRAEHRILPQPMIATSPNITGPSITPSPKPFDGLISAPEPKIELALNSESSNIESKTAKAAENYITKKPDLQSSFKEVIRKKDIKSPPTIEITELCCQCHSPKRPQNTDDKAQNQFQKIKCKNCHSAICEKCFEDFGNENTTDWTCKQCQNAIDEKQQDFTLNLDDQEISNEREIEKSEEIAKEKDTKISGGLNLANKFDQEEQKTKSHVTNARQNKQLSPSHLQSPLPRSKTIDFSKLAEYMEDTWDLNEPNFTGDDSIDHLSTELTQNDGDGIDKKLSEKSLEFEDKVEVEESVGIGEKKGEPEVEIHISQILVDSLVNKSKEFHPSAQRPQRKSLPTDQNLGEILKDNYSAKKAPQTAQTSSKSVLPDVPESSKITVPATPNQLKDEKDILRISLPSNDNSVNGEIKDENQTAKITKSVDPGSQEVDSDHMLCYNKLKEKLRFMSDQVLGQEDSYAPVCDTEDTKDSQQKDTYFGMETLERIGTGSDIEILLNYLLKIMAAKVSSKQTKIVSAPENLDENNYFSGAGSEQKTDSFITNTLNYLNHYVNQSNYNQLLELISGLESFDPQNPAFTDKNSPQKGSNRSLTLLKIFLSPLEKDLKFMHKTYGSLNGALDEMSMSSQKLGSQIEKCIRHKLVSELRSALNPALGSNHLLQSNDQIAGDMNEILTSFSRLITDQLSSEPKPERQTSPSLYPTFRTKFDRKIRDRLRMTNKMLKHIVETQQQQGDDLAFANYRLGSGSDKTSENGESSTIQSEEIFAKLDATTGLALMELQALEEKKRAIKAEIARRKGTLAARESGSIAKSYPSRTRSSNDLNSRLFPPKIMPHSKTLDKYNQYYDDTVSVRDGVRSEQDLRPANDETSIRRSKNAPSFNGNPNYGNFDNSYEIAKGRKYENNLLRGEGKSYDQKNYIENMHDSTLPDIVLSQNLRRDREEVLKDEFQANPPPRQTANITAKNPQQPDKQAQSVKYKNYKERKSLDNIKYESKPHQSSSSKKSIKKVILYKDPKFRDTDNENYGIKVIGGQTVDRQGQNSEDLGAYVIKVNRGGLNSDSLEQIQFGDKIVLWNGTPMSGKSFKEVQEIIKKSPQKIELILESTVAADYPSTLTSIKESNDEVQNSPNGDQKCPFSQYNYYFSLPYQAFTNFDHFQSNPQGELQVQIYLNIEAKMLTVTICKINLFKPFSSDINEEPFVIIRLLPLASPSHIKQTYPLDDSDNKCMDWFQTFMFQNVTQTAVQNKHLECSLWSRKIIPDEGYHYAEGDSENNGSEVLLGCTIIPLKGSVWLNLKKHWFNLYLPPEIANGSYCPTNEDKFMGAKCDTFVKSGGDVILVQNEEIRLDESRKNPRHNFTTYNVDCGRKIMNELGLVETAVMCNTAACTIL